MKSGELADSRYRQKGELEFRGIDRLPPTEISSEAKARFEKWGLSDEQIHELREFCASFRYDQCAERVARLAQSPAFVLMNGQVESVTLPNFYEVNSRLDGECSQIARQFLLQIEVSGLLEDINDEANLPKNSHIVPKYYTGYARTHFNTGDANHSWNGLSLVNANGQEAEAILIDLAFQRIQLFEESGYTEKTESTDPKLVYSKFHKTIPIGWIDIQKDSWTGNVPYAAVLGISKDKKYTYGLGFVRQKEKRHETLHRLLRRGEKSDPIPILIRSNEDVGMRYFFLNPVTGKLESNRNEESLQPEEFAEIMNILHAAHFSYTDDLNAYPPNGYGIQTIKWDK